jgi:hypothetical protein
VHFWPAISAAPAGVFGSGWLHPARSATIVTKTALAAAFAALATNNRRIGYMLFPLHR